MSDVEHMLGIVRDFGDIKGEMGEMKAEVRVIKHSLTNIDMSLVGLKNALNKIDNTQARGLGFFAGAAAVIGMVGGFLLFLAKLVFGGHG